MAFESGSVSFRIFSLGRKLPEDAVDQFAAHAAPPLDSVKEGESKGWVTGRHLLDRAIKEETALFGGYMRLTLRLAERKVPQSLLRAECRMEELAVMAAENKPYIKSAQRAEIRKSVLDRLLPQMPPQLRAMPFVCRPDQRFLYATALPVKQADQFSASFSQAVGFAPLPLTPDLAAAERAKLEVRDLHGTSFTPELEDGEMEVNLGREFLTWLWFAAEARGGTVALDELGEIAFMIEGPLVFVHEGNGAHETALRKGEPVHSAEARTCLLGGKKLKQARITCAIGEESWRCTLDADEFVFRGLTLPKGENLVEAVSRFQDRMIKLERFKDMFYGLYDRFLLERRDPKKWKKALSEVHEWVKARKGRV